MLQWPRQTIIQAVCIGLLASVGVRQGPTSAATSLRSQKYVPGARAEAVAWQQQVRSRLSAALQVTDLVAAAEDTSLNPTEVASDDAGAYWLKQVEISSTQARRIRVLVALPKSIKTPVPAVVCIHGHVVDLSSLLAFFRQHLGMPQLGPGIEPAE